MILAAGKGTRLAPLTDHTPKALVDFNGKKLLERVILNLRTAGFDEIIVNVFHFAEQIRDFLDERNHFDIRVEPSDETERLLNTGGGLKKASWFFGNEPFLLHNVDVLTGLDLISLYRAHLSGNSLVTLAVKKRSTTRPFLFTRSGYLAGWRNLVSGEERIIRNDKEKLIPLGNSCIQVVDPRIFSLITEEGAFSLTGLYLRLAAQYPIRAYRHDSDYWYDLGRYENFRKAEKLFRGKET